MSKKKQQIEEMAKVIDEFTEPLSARDIHKAEFSEQFAEHLYNAGYRKQSKNTIELPCKVGDTVYVPWRWDGQQGVATVNIEEIKFYDTQMHYMFLIDMESDDECFNQNFGGWKIEQSIGKTVFFTREEAEKALAERRKK